ncbi:Alpha/Beta hydrolase protein [Neohortaea acidophila]|uniref:Alpha/Beta hydrolase protein n=1 Tax=Neohortaea acidophila TaxID=245834 RepID=A0A6A6PKA5_9PEZI|nr:Alpha/Beta hydrolase protein [Neohortaea acidophila]KAF2480365.1 Alpha/Beta hydrolase protein [Neohortaea acidophila]
MQANGHADHSKDHRATKYARQAEQLGRVQPGDEEDGEGPSQAVKAKFITPLDPILVTADGGRLPPIPVDEAKRLNELRKEVHKSSSSGSLHSLTNGLKAVYRGVRGGSNHDGTSLADSLPPSRTNPLFPPLPIYGPPTLLREIQCFFFRITSAVLSLAFLLTIFAGTVICQIPRLMRDTRSRAMLQNPRKLRPFYDEEKKRASERKAAEKAWKAQQKNQKKGSHTPLVEKGASVPQDGEYVPTEGGPDPLCVDIAYYARRVGLDVEIFDVQTEDGFIIELWHVFNPREQSRTSSSGRKNRGPELSEYPVLMIHGLLQSSGAFCCNDDDSLAFYLAKSGYDVWLGNNRCGFEPKHTKLEYTDPRMWAWNIRHMGVLDLPALVNRVLVETGFPKLALIAHSQGTTQTFVALAKEQRPELGEKISVFCALAPAAYAGPLIGKIYFRVMRTITPAMFRIIFGIHAFIPFMMFAHKIFPARPYSLLGYYVFSHLFNWSDTRWDRGLRDRMFQWAPVYVSAESMRWWLGRECFAKQRCILATREEGRQEDKEDEEDDERNVSSFHCQSPVHLHHDTTRGKFAWYNDQFPPLALWVAGADDLVDGRRLLRRFDRGREPHVRVVHKKIIEGYEHLDVIWAMDSIEKCGKEVREVIWRTVDPETALQCRVPVGCAKPLEEDPDITEDVPMLHSGGRLRMASISEGLPTVSSSSQEPSSSRRRTRTRRGTNLETTAETHLDSTAETEGEHDHMVEEKEQFHPAHLEEPGFTDIAEKSNPLG